MATVNLYLDTRHEKKDGTYTVKFNVRHIGQQLISTDFSCKKEEWNGTEFNRRCPNYKAKNMALHAVEQKIHLMLIDLEAKGELVNMSDSKLKICIKELIYAKENQKSKDKLLT